MRSFVSALALASIVSSSPVQAGTKAVTASGYALPKDKPVTIVLMRPDTDVGQLAAGGLPQPNADWTTAARDNLVASLKVSASAKQLDLRTIDEHSGEAGQLVADYTALHKAVADSIIQHKYYGAKLPTKKDRFDWTMGPGAQKLGELSGGNYALFLYTRDNFASASRKTMQVAGMLGCIVGFCMIVSGGTHVAYRGRLAGHGRNDLCELARDGA